MAPNSLSWVPSMSLEKLLRDRRLVKQVWSDEDLRNLLGLAEDNLKNASVTGVSLDGVYIFAYGAAQSLAAVIVRGSGHKTRGLGHHETLFETLGLLLPSEKEVAAYFNRCREKRNTISYKAPNQATPEQTKELVERAGAFQKVVIQWLKANRSDVLTPPPPPATPNL